MTPSLFTIFVHGVLKEMARLFCIDGLNYKPTETSVGLLFNLH